MEPPSTPLAAVTHADPYPYYASLVAQRPFYRDDALGLWVASSNDCPDPSVQPRFRNIPRAV